MSHRPPEVTAKCPKCGLRVMVSALAQTLVGPRSTCEHKEGWVRCPNLEPEISGAIEFLR
jgi:hypothetical protein